MELTKGKNGWRALTQIDIPDVVAHGGREGKPGKSVLQIETAKGYNGGICTVARVIWQGDTFHVHALGMGSGRGDFFATVLQTPGRCTEKTVKAQHEEVLTHADAILAHARQFYAMQAQQRG